MIAKPPATTPVARMAGESCLVRPGHNLLSPHCACSCHSAHPSLRSPCDRQAAASLSAELKDCHPEIPWKDIARFRNVVTHTSMGQLNLACVWDYIATLADLVSVAEAELRRVRG